MTSFQKEWIDVGGTDQHKYFMSFLVEADRKLQFQTSLVFSLPYVLHRIFNDQQVPKRQFIIRLSCMSTLHDWNLSSTMLFKSPASTVKAKPGERTLFYLPIQGDCLHSAYCNFFNEDLRRQHALSST